MDGSTGAIEQFLAGAIDDTSALVLDGEAGIGKTTRWFEAMTRARELGFRVISAQLAAAESELPYTALADLLRGLDEEASVLPDLQKHALERVLLQSDTADWRVLAAAFLALLDLLSSRSPVLIAVDDLQWVDPSSRRVLARAARRLPAHVSIVATVGTEPLIADAAGWLKLAQPSAIRRITIAPMTLSELHEVIARDLHQALPRPAMLRIHEIAGGNPLFAVELARAWKADGTTVPTRVVELMHSRIDGLAPQVREILLAAACARAATVQLVAQAIGSDEGGTVELLEHAENRKVLTIDGNRLRFVHPILAYGVYIDATAAQRRAMHRRLAEIVEAPELRARHVALGATGADHRTLQSLDAAAETAGARGDSASAAELLDLAIGLGGDTPARRIRLARRYFDACDLVRARRLLEESTDRPATGAIRGEALFALAVILMYDAGYPQAISVIERALADVDDDPVLRLRLLVAMSYALLHCGEIGRAAQIADAAVGLATASHLRDLLSAAIAMQAVVRFVFGRGVDEVGMRRAADLHDGFEPIPLAVRPDLQIALLSAWSGALDDAARSLSAIRHDCIARGEEGELLVLALHAVLIEVWRGNFSDATLIAKDTSERAAQMGGGYAALVASLTRAIVSAYAGEEDQARAYLSDARAASALCGAQWLADWVTTTLGFLEVSLGNYNAALQTLEPLRSRLVQAPEQTEIITAAFVPDLVESMLAVGQVDGAEELVAALESNGRRTDRAWTLAVGARCRGLLCAARGDLDSALAAVHRAMDHHQHLAMPFEAARTRLLLGEIQRRHRSKGDSGENLRAATAAFESLEAPLWAQRARTSLARADVLRPQSDDGLTPSERRVAELVATGMTNRAIASALFISPKTVEANLARIYRKLDIPSRAALASYVSDTPARATADR
jgi:DNA-binding CsgD family transcriptional regulator